MASNPKESATNSGATLRRPVQIVKKRSGPLDDALAELGTADNIEKDSSIPSVSASAATASASASTSTSSAATGGISFSPSTSSISASHSTRRRQSHFKEKEKEKRRERWLLTRKTWKYMTDAGRKLIPEGVQNRKEDIPKIEAHFQQVCSAEPRFILWRRKSSYPGAMRSSKRRLKQLLQHTGQKPMIPLTVEQIEQDEANNADQIIDLLQSYLKLDEACKTTTLLGSKTVRPDQTASPSAQRPGQNSSRSMRNSGAGFLGMHMPTRDPFQQLNEIDQLLERLKALQRSATSPAVAIPPELITRDILQDKALLKQIYNSLKKQQLHRILSKHSSGGSSLGGSAGPTTSAGFSSAHSMSLSSLLTFGTGGSHLNAPIAPSRRNAVELRISPVKESTVPTTINSSGIFHSSSSKTDSTPTKPIKKTRTRRSPPKSLDLSTAQSATASKRKTAQIPPPVQKSYNACGTQTNFIPLQEIKRLAEEYKEQRREASAATANTDDEAEKQASKTGQSAALRRKSSIDNEDISQSVSDTIKRYLRMARKKSVHDDAANRFKRVNYDRNLRNIRAKGEINPPGMDEGNSKAIQTLDAWPLITLDFIRGNENSGILETAHTEWEKALDERIQKKLEYERTLAENTKKSGSRSCSSSSAPTSPTSPLSTSSEQAGGTSGTLKKNQQRSSSNYLGAGSGSTGSGAGGILHSSSQFLSNLWHGGHHNDDVSNKSSISLNSNSSGSKASMQKSKSSSNVGQFVSRKILRSRSKSQTRPSSTASGANYTKWAPADKNTWTSDTGERLQLADAPLQYLSDTEAKFLQRVAIEKISELNIGINIKLDKYEKAQKRRALPKKKAMTTSFFDIGKKDDQGSCFGIFGNSLECCIANDRRQSKSLNGALKERGSRGSIASIFRSGGENIRSCESLPSTTAATATTNESAGKVSGSFFGGLTKSSSMLLSSSQWDMRRKSQDFEGSEEFQNAKGFEEEHAELQVPTFVHSCIRYLEDNGLNKVGLFRVSTSKKRVKQMREDFNKNHARKIETDTCPHDVATLLKEFLRDLPEPLLCNHLYKAFLQTQKIRNRRLQMEAISHLIKLLPAVHRDTLYVLLRFLAQVAAHSDDVATSDGNVQISGNKMDSNNLATVFAPNILRTATNESGTSGDGTDVASQQESMADAINVIRTMIDHFEELFKVPAELIDIAYSYMLDECPEQLFSICEQRNLTIARNEASSSISPLSSPDQVVLDRTDSKNLDELSAKKFYTRQSVMHENDASRSHEDEVMKAPIRSNSRRFENRNSRKERYSSRDLTPTERRQSSPNVLGKANIVSGSLQISVPIQTRNPTPSNDALQVNKAFQHSTQVQYADLPYIEDVFYSPTDEMGSPNDCLPVSGLLSISTRTDGSLSRRNFDGAHDSNVNLSLTATSAIANAKAPASATATATTTPSTLTTTILKTTPSAAAMTTAAIATTNRTNTSLNEDGAFVQNLKIGEGKKRQSNEPKLPASISNIGGAILRSKTADFERMSLYKQPTVQKSKSNTTTGNSPTGSHLSTTSTVQHLYKRQELISSSKGINSSK